MTWESFQKTVTREVELARKRSEHEVKIVKSFWCGYLFCGDESGNMEKERYEEAKKFLEEVCI